MDGLIWVFKSFLINSIYIINVWRVVICIYDNIIWINVIKFYYIFNYDIECCVIFLYLILFIVLGFNYDLIIFYVVMVMKNKVREVSKYMIEIVFIC